MDAGVARNFILSSDSNFKNMRLFQISSNFLFPTKLKFEVIYCGAGRNTGIGSLSLAWLSWPGQGF